METTISPTLDSDATAATGTRHAQALGSGQHNLLGDLHALQHLGSHLARSMRGVFEPLLRRQPRVTAEPLATMRFDDYLDARPAGLASITLVGMAPLNGQAMIVLEGALVLEMVDLFFGGTGTVPSPLPGEFTPTADAMIARTTASLADRLARAWGELAEIDFRVGKTESNPAMLSHIDGEDRVVLTRFDMTLSDTRSTRIDILYPVGTLKPIAPILSAKVQSKRGGADPAWMSGLTRAVMNVELPVRSVLAEPVVSLARLMALKTGDIIPISFGPDVPLLVADNRFAHGAVGAANGRAAIRVNRIEKFEDEDKK
jgi:flagellar motor switch protein FliM